MPSLRTPHTALRNGRSRRGIVALRELLIVAVLVGLLFCALDGANDALQVKLPDDAAANATFPAHGLTVDSSGEHLWILRRRDAIGAMSLPGLEESGLLPIDPHLMGCAMASAEGHCWFAGLHPDGRVEILRDGACVVEDAIVESFATPWSMGISSDGRVVVVAIGDGTVHRWRRSDAGFQHDRRAAPVSSERLWLDHTGRTMAVLSNRNEICVWDFDRDACLGRWNVEHSSFCSALCLSGDGDRLATVGQDARLKVWDAASGRLIWERKADSLDAFGATFSPCGRWIATGGFDKRVRVWDAATGALATEHTGHELAPRIFAWSADGRTLYSTGLDGQVRVWPAPQ